MYKHLCALRACTWGVYILMCYTMLVLRNSCQYTVRSNNTDCVAAGIIASYSIVSVFLTCIALLLCCHIYCKICWHKKKIKCIYDRIHITNRFHHNLHQPPSTPPDLPPRRISVCTNPVYNCFDPAVDPAPRLP